MIILSNELYLSSQKIIRAHVNRVHFLTGADKDDLQSQADWIFIRAAQTYDADKSAWSSWLWECLRSLRYKTLFGEVPVEEIPHSEFRIEFDDYEPLSPDARAVLDLLLNDQIESGGEKQQHHASASKTKEHMGWSRPKTEKVWDELKTWYRTTF